MGLVNSYSLFRFPGGRASWTISAQLMLRFCFSSIQPGPARNGSAREPLQSQAMAPLGDFCATFHATARHLAIIR